MEERRGSAQPKRFGRHCFVVGASLKPATMAGTASHSANMQSIHDTSTADEGPGLLYCRLQKTRTWNVSMAFFTSQVTAFFCFAGGRQMNFSVGACLNVLLCVLIRKCFYCSKEPRAKQLSVGYSNIRKAVARRRASE